MAYMDSYYVLSLNILKALGGDTSIVYPDADAIWDEINKIYNNAGNRFDIVPLEKNITENGQYDYYPDGDVDAFMPVNINVNVPQKYTDEQVFEIESNAIQQGYNQGYTEGEAEGKLTGREEGYTDGYNTGYGTGVTDGSNTQKAKLVDITITENGVYTKDDGYKTVTVEVETGIPEEELQQMLQEAMDEGYQDGYAEGVDDGKEDGIAEQKEKLESTTITENGTYTREDGWNEVTVQVDVPTFETETLSVELKSNGNYNYTPTTDGYSSVEVVVNVASSVEEGSLYDFTTGLGVDATVNMLLNDAITEDVNYTKSLEASYVKPSWQGAKLYYNNSKLRYGPNIDTSGLTSLGNNRDGNSSSSQYGIFQGCPNLIWVPSLNTSSVTDWGHAFSGCYALQRIEPMDFSKCINLTDTFRNCMNLEELPFSTPLKITYNNSPFFMCQKLKHIPYIDTSNCTYFGYMYSGCIALESPIELDLTKAQTWGSSSTYGSTITINGVSYTYYGSTFGDCRKVPSIKLLNISPNCKYWNYMFMNCYELSNLEMTFQEGFVPTHASAMFSGCRNLEEIPWFDTSKLTNAQNMFSSCNKLKRIPNCDFSSCTGSYYPSFSYCYALEEFGGDLILSKCTSVHGNMFSEVSCPLPNIYIEAATSMGELLRYYTGTTVGNIISSKAQNISLGMSKYSTKVETIGTIDASSATGITMFSDYMSEDCPILKNLGGFINYGMKSNASSISSSNAGFWPCNNLTRDSLMNIINNLYDRTSAGYSVLTIKFHPDALARLSEDDIAIATNKGWTLS